MYKHNESTRLASVIIPVYNRGELVERTIDSVYKQVYRPIELVIVNDGSNDNSEDVILKWKEKHESLKFKILHIRQKNKGAPNARNNGLKNANGQYIQFLDSDDLLEKEKISEQVRGLNKNNSEIAVCDFIYVNQDGKTIKKSKNMGNLWLKMAKGGSLSIFTPLFRRSILSKGLIWDENLKRNQDMDFISKLMLLTKKYVYTPGYWCLYFQHDQARISDLYTKTAPEFWKRIKGLMLFFIKNFHSIPKKNFVYFILSIIKLSEQWLVYYPRMFIKKHVPFAVKLKRMFSKSNF